MFCAVCYFCLWISDKKEALNLSSVNRWFNVTINRTDPDSADSCAEKQVLWATAEWCPSTVPPTAAPVKQPKTWKRIRLRIFCQKLAFMKGQSVTEEKPTSPTCWQLGSSSCMKPTTGRQSPPAVRHSWQRQRRCRRSLLLSVLHRSPAAEPRTGSRAARKPHSSSTASKESTYNHTRR